MNTENHLPSAKGKANRRAVVLGFAMIVPVVLLIGTLAAVPLMARRAHSEPGTEYALGNLRARADLIIATAGDFTLTLMFVDSNDAPARPAGLVVTAVMEMGGMSPLQPQMREVSVGKYEATGRLTMQGRWRFLTQTDQGRFELTGYAGPSF